MLVCFCLNRSYFFRLGTLGERGELSCTAGGYSNVRDRSQPTTLRTPRPCFRPSGERAPVTTKL